MVPATVGQQERRLVWKNPSPLIPRSLFLGRGLNYILPWKLASGSKVNLVDKDLFNVCRDADVIVDDSTWLFVMFGCRTDDSSQVIVPFVGASTSLLFYSHARCS